MGGKNKIRINLGRVLFKGRFFRKQQIARSVSESTRDRSEYLVSWTIDNAACARMRNTFGIYHVHIHTYINTELSHRHVRQSVCIATRERSLSHSIKARADRGARPVASRTSIGEPRVAWILSIAEHAVKL